MSKNMIAVTAFLEDAACCLIQDGMITAAAKEEWFTRVRHDNTMPKNAFLYCLEEGNITLLDVDVLVCCKDSQRIADEAREFWGYNGSIKLKNTMPDIHGFLGKKYTDTYIKRLLDDTGLVYRFFENERLIVHIAASLLAQGFMIGWYQGRMEFGRAIGNRIILMNPCSVIKSPWSFATLIPEKNIMIGKLATEFFDLTEFENILYASFCMPGEPLVESPENAVECFINTDMDYLFLGSYQIGRFGNEDKIEKYRNIYKKLWPHTVRKLL